MDANTDDFDCLVIMPFGGATSEKLFYTMAFDHIIKPACTAAGVSGGRIDRFNLGMEPITTALEERLKNAAVVVADVSDNNPNVQYELGFRKAQGKEFVCVSRNPDAAAFWTKNFRIIDYTRDDAHALIASAVSAAYSRFRARSKVELALASLTSTASPKYGFRNSFQDLLSAWRVSRATTELREIQAEKWSLEAMSASDYVNYIFTEIVNLLEAGDTYSTVTNMAFWQDKAIHDTAFLDCNSRAAANGVVVRRVFIIDKAAWEDSMGHPRIREIAQQHANACRRVELQASQIGGAMVARGLLTQDYEGTFGKYGHFGLAKRPSTPQTPGASMIIEPRFLPQSPSSGMSELEIYFPYEGAKDFRRLQTVERKFVEAFDKAVDLEELLQQ